MNFNRFLTILFNIFFLLNYFNLEARVVKDKELKEILKIQLKVISQLSLKKPYKNISYDLKAIDPNGSLSVSTYKKEYVTKNVDILLKRIKSALAYKKKGNIEQFYNISIDIITRNNFNQEAAWVALLLGDFERSIYNLEEAYNYYIYVVNVHYNSKYGFNGLLKLGLVLNQMNYLDESEEVFKMILNTENGNKAIKKKAKEILKSKYLQLARWYLEKKDDDKVVEYYKQYLELD